jgi:hypothetical protein
MLNGSCSSEPAVGTTAGDNISVGEKFQQRPTACPLGQHASTGRAGSLGDGAEQSGPDGVYG